MEKKNKQLFVEITKYQNEIIKNPQNVGYQLKGDLKEFRSLDFKFRQASLRICYVYHEDDDHVNFVYAGTRENFYDEVKRYVN
ncbi:MAG: type II toxin-antitoxin system RelE/ParE family toxin [Bacillus sp. (in: firmicutes)]